MSLSYIWRDYSAKPEIALYRLDGTEQYGQPYFYVYLDTDRIYGTMETGVSGYWQR